MLNREVVKICLKCGRWLYNSQIRCWTAASPGGLHFPVTIHFSQGPHGWNSLTLRLMEAPAWNGKCGWKWFFAVFLTVDCQEKQNRNQNLCHEWWLADTHVWNPMPAYIFRCSSYLAWTNRFPCCKDTGLPCRCVEVPFAQWKHLVVDVLIKPEIELGGEEGDKDRKEAKPAISPRELLLCKLKWKEREWNCLFGLSQRRENRSHGREGRTIHVDEFK